MKKLLLTIVYATLCYIPLLLLMNVFDLADSWWINILLLVFSYFNGSFIYTQFHGNQVIELQHFYSHLGTHRFQVTLKVSGHGLFNGVGQYVRIEQYSNRVLQNKIFNAINAFPGNKWIKDFVKNRNDMVLNISVPDYEQPHPLNFTQITLEKYEGNSVHDKQSGLKTRAELEKEFDGLSKYEIGMKLWNQEQELLTSAREKGVEDQLIAYWEAQGRPRMKNPPIKED